MTLSLYIARRFLAMVLRVFLVFLGILALIDVIDQLRRFSGDGIGLGQAAGLTLLNVPGSLYSILPLVLILGSIALFLGLARSSELVVIRASGRSALRFLVAPLMVALILGLVSVGVLNPLVAATGKGYAQLSALYSTGSRSVLSINASGLWLRQGGAEGQTVIHAARANADATQLTDVSFLSYDASGGVSTRVDAATAELVPGAWVLREAKRWTLTAANPEASAETLAELRLPSDLTRQAIIDGFGAPSTIQFWALPDHIARLEAAGFSARSHRVWYQMELALPLLFVAMVLIAAGFTMRHARGGRTGILVLLSLLTGFGIFFLRNFAQVLGENGQIPVILAAWSPPVAAALGSLGLLLHLEDG